MSSQKRIEASRANGRLSHGPATAAGKSRSAQNSTRHGLLARCLVLADESPEAFQAVLDQFVERLRPADDLELSIVEEMVGACWRLRRSWAVETHLIDTVDAGPGEIDALDRITDAFKSLAETRSLLLVHRYETRLHMVYQRALRNLMLIRSAMPTALPDLPNEPRSDLFSTPPPAPDPSLDSRPAEDISTLP